MKIINISINKIKPNEYNPRIASKAQKKRVRESISKFGIVDPLILNKHPERMNYLVGGHLRYEVLRELGVREVPVVYVDLTLEEEQELCIRLNKNTGEFNWDLLAHFDQKLLQDVGFDLGELQIIKGEFVAPEQPGIDHNAIKTKHTCPKCGYEWG